jgi:N-dimethylarginine dimethylaminohydrolase
MKENTVFSQTTAQKQWEKLYELYQQIMPTNISKIKPKEGLTELCFFGDSVFAYKDKAVFSRFSTPERYAETDYVINVLKERGITGERVPEHLNFEGSGETMFWNSKILVGYGQRSSQGIAEYLQDQFQTETIGLELIDPVFYHLDTALFPISNEHIAFYPKAFSSEALKKIRQLNCNLIEVSFEEARSFALNSIAVSNTIIVHSEATGFCKQLKALGYTIQTVDVSEFIKFGGGLKCLTFQHYL